MSLTISALMQSGVCSVDIDATVSQVEALLAEKKLSWVPVLEKGNIVIGVISASDLTQFHAQERDAKAVRAWQLCSYKPLVVDANAPAADVARQMVERHVHHVVVMRADDIAGVVSSLDFVRRFTDKG